MEPQVTFSIIFLVVILLLISEVEHRALVAMLAALLSVYFGTSYNLFSFHDLPEMMELDVVMFITCVLILFDAIGRSGLFDFIGLSLVKKVGKRPTLIVLMLILLTTIFSGISTNIMVVLLVGGITLKVADMLKLDGKKIILLECSQTDVGGLLLPISSIPALIIVTKTRMSFFEYVKVSIPLVILSTIVALIYTKFLNLTKTGTGTYKEETLDPWSAVKNPTALYRSFIIFFCFLCSITLYDRIGLPPSYLAFFFATLTFLLSGLNPDEIFRNVDWSIPFFVGGFFIFIGGLERSGVLDQIAHVIAPLILNTNILIGAPLLLLFCALVSAVIDNVPVVLFLYPIVRDIAMQVGMSPQPFYWALIIGGNLGGRITTFGSPSVLTGVRMLERAGEEVSLKEYVKIGLPLALSQILLGMAYLSLLTFFGVIK